MILSTLSTLGASSEGSGFDEAVDVEGEVSVLMWEGIGNSVPKWRPFNGRVRHGYLYVENAKKEIVRWVFLDNEIEIHQLPEKWAFGKKHAIGILPRNVGLEHAAESSDSLILALKDAVSTVRWNQRIQAAQKEILSLTIDQRGCSFITNAFYFGLDSLTDVEVEPSDPIPARSGWSSRFVAELYDCAEFRFAIEAEVNEVSVFLYGRPSEFDTVSPQSSSSRIATSSTIQKWRLGVFMSYFDRHLVSMHGEVPLALSLQGPSKLSCLFDTVNGLKIDFGISQYAIEDLLVYQRTGKRAYLATSTGLLIFSCFV